MIIKIIKSRSAGAVKACQLPLLTLGGQCWFKKWCIGQQLNVFTAQILQLSC